jgi:hypothetical protein
MECARGGPGAPKLRGEWRWRLRGVGVKGDWPRCTGIPRWGGMFLIPRPPMPMPMPMPMPPIPMSMPIPKPIPAPGLMPMPKGGGMPCRGYPGKPPIIGHVLRPPPMNGERPPIGPAPGCRSPNIALCLCLSISANILSRPEPSLPLAYDSSKCLGRCISPQRG